MTQAEQILRFMQVGKSITPISALNIFGCFRLGARICDLRQKGHKIERIMKKGLLTRKTFAEYSMPEHCNG